MTEVYLPHSATLRSSVGIVRAAFVQTFIVWKAYKGALIFFIVLSIVFAMLPIFLGRYIGGDNFAANFEASGGGKHPEAFILLGTNGWMLVLFALWDYAGYLREEQQQGTLESLFLTPAHQSLIIMGRGAFSALLATGTFLVGVTVGLLLLDPEVLFSLDIIPFSIAVGMLILGFVPVLGLSMAIGAMVVRFKEINNILNVLQFFFGSLMGVFFPITMLPLAGQVLSFLFPGTWLVQDIRYVVAGSPPMLTLLGLEKVLGNFPVLFDFLVLLVLAVAWAFAGWAVFSRTLGRLKKNEGIGQY